MERFSLTMDRELAPWTTTESRNLRGRPGNEPLLAEARRLVGIGRFEAALEIYREVHLRDGNVLAGFNAALMLAAIEEFEQALELLESLHGEMMKAGQNTPRFILREIQRMSGFVAGRRMLEERRRTTDATLTPAPEGSTDTVGDLPTAAGN